MPRSEKYPINPGLREEYLQRLFSKEARTPDSEWRGAADGAFLSRLLSTPYGNDPTRFWKLNAQVQDRLGEEGRIRALACWANWLRTKHPGENAHAADADEMVLRLAAGPPGQEGADGLGAFHKRLALSFGLDHAGLSAAGAQGSRMAGFIRAPQSGNFYLVEEDGAYALGPDPYEAVEKAGRLLARSTGFGADGRMATFSDASDPALVRGMGWMEESVREAGGKMDAGKFGEVNARFPAHVRSFRMGCFALSGGPAFSLESMFGAIVRFKGEDMAGRACNGRIWLPRVDLSCMAAGAPGARPFGFSSYLSRDVDIRLDPAGEATDVDGMALPPDGDGRELGFVLYGEGRTEQTYIRVKKAYGDDGLGYYTPPKKTALEIEGEVESGKTGGEEDGAKGAARRAGISLSDSRTASAEKETDRLLHMVAFGQLDYAGRIYKPYFGMQIRTNG
ncbi:MAG: hypothetical protein V1728_04370 [Candidatus Micrarchaeota archaeon]